MLDTFPKSIAALIGLVSLSASCATPRPEAPDVAFRALEERLLDARVIRLAFHVTAEGAVAADIRGFWRWGPEPRSWSGPVACSLATAWICCCSSRQWAGRVRERSRPENRGVTAGGA